VKYRDIFTSWGPIGLSRFLLQLFGSFNYTLVSTQFQINSAFNSGFERTPKKEVVACSERVIYLEGLKNMTKILSPNGRFLGRDSNQERPAYELDVPTVVSPQ
jgi:hypothetical protein